MIVPSTPLCTTFRYTARCAIGVLVIIACAGCQPVPPQHTQALATSAAPGTAHDEFTVAGPAVAPAPTIPNFDAYPIHWDTQVVRLGADAFTIEAGDRSFGQQMASLDLHSDPGVATYRTLELIWHEQGTEMRLNMYFAADDTSWWVSEIRTYNGQHPGDWIYYYGEFFRTPKGAIYTGDVDLTSTPNSPIHGKLHFRNLHLAAW